MIPTPPPASPVLTKARLNCVAHVEEPRGKLEVFLPRDSVCLTVVEGNLSLAMARRWIEALDRPMQRGAVFDIFNDWERMSNYESAARQSLTSWVIGSLRGFRSVHFLVSNRLVRMGVSAASAAVAIAGMHMESCGDRESFERVLVRFV
jgi:hypothetical protein